MGHGRQNLDPSAHPLRIDGVMVVEPRPTHSFKDGDAPIVAANYPATEVGHHRHIWSFDAFVRQYEDELTRILPWLAVR